MKRQSLVLPMTMLIVFALAGCSTGIGPGTSGPGGGGLGIKPSHPIAKVIDSSNAGTPPEDVVREIRRSYTSYALKGSDFGKLRRAGVKDPVLNHIQAQFYGDVDLLVRYWINGESLGGCQECNPQQVDLTGLENGAAPKTYPPKIKPTFGIAPGLPDWYRPLAASLRRPAMPLSQVQDMIKNKTPDDEIVRRLRAGRLVDVIGVGGISNIDTRVAIGVSGKQLADMRDQGVSDAVLDELQASYLTVYVDDSTKRYQDVGKGSRGR